MEDTVDVVEPASLRFAWGETAEDLTAGPSILQTHDFYIRQSRDEEGEVTKELVLTDSLYTFSYHSMCFLIRTILGDHRTASPFNQLISAVYSASLVLDLGHLRGDTIDSLWLEEVHDISIDGLRIGGGEVYAQKTRLTFKYSTTLTHEQVAMMTVTKEKKGL